MKIKNVILTSAAAALLMGSSVAMAQELTTTNNSSDYSAVSVDGLCSGLIGQWTGPGQKVAHTQWSTVTKLCKKSSGTCTAKLYLGSNSAKYCMGGSTTTVSMNLGNGSIKVANPALGGKKITTSNYALNINN